MNVWVNLKLLLVVLEFKVIRNLDDYWANRFNLWWMMTSIGEICAWIVHAWGISLIALFTVYIILPAVNSDFFLLVVGFSISSAESNGLIRFRPRPRTTRPQTTQWQRRIFSFVLLRVQRVKPCVQLLSTNQTLLQALGVVVRDDEVCRPSFFPFLLYM